MVVECVGDRLNVIAGRNDDDLADGQIEEEVTFPRGVSYQQLALGLPL